MVTHSETRDGLQSTLQQHGHHYYDDSDGGYDHAVPPIVPPSNVPRCTRGVAAYRPRLPLLVISPYSKVNYVDHNVTDQSSVLRFNEDNWGVGRIGDSSFDVDGN